MDIRKIPIYLVVICVFAVAGCGMPFLTEPVHIPPSDFDVSSLKNSLLGSSKQEVLIRLGPPSYTFSNAENDYFVYQRMGTEIILLGVSGMNGYPIYCYSLNFDHEDILREVNNFNCNAIPQLLVDSLRAKAVEGQVDAAAVLAVRYSEKSYLEKLSAKDGNAKAALALIQYAEKFKDIPLSGLTDDELKKRALDGNPEASYQLYWNQAEPDPHFWLCHSADLGQSQARYRIGILYWNGAEGIRQDYIQSFKWFSLAAQVGNYEAWKEVRRIENEVFNSDDASQSAELINSWDVGQCKQELMSASSGGRR